MMKAALISQSPDEVREYFFQYLKKHEREHKVKVWSRKDSNIKDEELIFLSQRDYNFLSKDKSLPDSKRLIILFTEKSNTELHKLDKKVEMICYIAGTEMERGILAGEFYLACCGADLITQHKEWTELSLESLKKIVMPGWMKSKLGSVLVDLTPLNSDVSFFQTGERLLLKAMIPKMNMSPTLLSKSIRLQNEEEFDLNLLIMSRIYHECSSCLIDEKNKDSTTLYISFTKTLTQKKFDNGGRMFGVIK